tara:strand:- start:1364 stop:1699 length:336 start_codon:yes stop_codon:yes gene_type:complete
MIIYDMQKQPSQNEYSGCGRAWVALNQGKVVGIRYMDDHTGVFTSRSPEVLIAAGRKRECPWSQYVAERMNEERFLLWRDRAKRELAGLGVVVGGMMSCWKFYADSKFSNV